MLFRSELLPEDTFAQAKIDEWMFWEQYSHEPYITVSRFQMRYQGRKSSERDDWRVERGEWALDYMNSQLESRQWLVGDRFSIADIALVAYTRVAHEGGFDLASRLEVKAWVKRCEAEFGIASDT